MEHKTVDCICEGRECKDCNEIKCIEYFALYSKRICRTCYNKGRHEWALAHPESIKASQRKCGQKRYKQTPEYIKKIRDERAKQWHADHPENIKEVTKAYKINHPDKMNQYRRKWDRKHPNYLKKWEADHPENIRERSRKRRAAKAQSEGHYTELEWKTLKAEYHHKCLCCGNEEPKIKLTADHIVPISKRGSDNIDNIQPLCKSCNSRKATKTIDYRNKSSAS